MPCRAVKMIRSSVSLQTLDYLKYAPEHKDITSLAPELQHAGGQLCGRPSAALGARSVSRRAARLTCQRCDEILRLTLTRLSQRDQLIARSVSVALTNTRPAY